MSASAIRLALVGCSGKIDAYRDAAARLDGGCMTVVVDSLETALDEHAAAFDAVASPVTLVPGPRGVDVLPAALPHVRMP